MIFLAIMLFMIGQALNMGTGYWVILVIWLFFKIIFNVNVIDNKEPNYLEKRIADKIDQVIDEIVEDEIEEAKED